MQVKNNSLRNKQTTIVLIAYLALNILFFLVSAVSRTGLGGDNYSVFMQAIRIVMAACYFLWFTMFGLSGVFFMFWMRRAYYNIRQISPSNTSFRDGWAIAAWFIPFLNLFMPYKIMREIWYETQFAMYKGASEFGDTRDGSLVVIWWIFYLVASLVPYFSLPLMGEGSEGPVNYFLVLSLCSIPGLLISIRLLKQLGGFETAFWASLKLSEISGKKREEDL